MKDSPEQPCPAESFSHLLQFPLIGSLPRVGETRRAVFGVDFGPVGFGFVSRFVMMHPAAVYALERSSGSSRFLFSFVISSFVRFSFFMMFSFLL